jgi:hypothetical protein
VTHVETSNAAANRNPIYLSETEEDETMQKSFDFDESLLELSQEPTSMSFDMENPSPSGTKETNFDLQTENEQIELGEEEETKQITTGGNFKLHF